MNRAARYETLAREPELDPAISALADAELRELAAYLAETGAERGVPGLIRSLLMIEGFHRFMKKPNPPEENAGGGE